MTLRPQPTVIESVITSVVTSLGAVAICVPIGYLMANLSCAVAGFRSLAPDR